MENNIKEAAETSVTKPGYIMVNMKVKSMQELGERYAQYAIPTLHKHGGIMIAGTPSPIVKEGDWSGNWAAVLQFPSMAAAEAWYNSEEYQPYKELRINELQQEAGRIVFLEGLSS
jgi:uncharacterized protein (DUF1330 family)